ncbi:hypothetical protein G3I59_07180 [Amycolatopsis rubida]|uniref:Uncharacterized protein n=1 Tax=Amycolatopsis rubida TaxID=112413 RepID=A0ABX0BIT9_9PSEU|nr:MULTISPECIES: hypothetical protein [Amycolatopsis]MYW90410.1 hypothetical protein [Amycolatopsis rubida]NEC55387.1 hypothetical protein [Amycolatopsis rubida]OAP21854.1 hypothetical protein A4R44_07312 [Amycolatopsis sp. M39]
MVLRHSPQTRRASSTARTPACSHACALKELGDTEELAARGILVSKFTVREHDRVPPHIDLGELPRAHPYALLVPQDITEQMLMKRKDSEGVTVLASLPGTGSWRR